jgi:diguanylate cyclase (GGDEF)-like protein
MERVLLEVKNSRDRKLLEEWLAPQYQLLPPDPTHELAESFDLAIIDGPSLKRLRRKVRARRHSAEPVLLPFLLLTVRRKGRRPTRHLGKLVDDLIVGPLDPVEVCARVANLLRMLKLSLQLKKEHDLVVKLSNTDDVSGFHNTRYMHRYLDRFFSARGGSATTERGQKRCVASANGDEELSLVFFDLDNFKAVVDSYGHLLGAKAQREVAQTVGAALDEPDRLVRYGGDEYVVILPHHSKERALQKVERVRQQIAQTAFLHKEGLDVHLSASFGVATYPHDATTKRELLAAADHCLFESKSAGKNRISAATPRVKAEEGVAAAA